jgi:transposase-like protein
MRCDRCAGERFTKAGWDRARRQLYRFSGCSRRLIARTGSACSGYRLPDEVIALAVRWYLRNRLSYAEVAEWLAERGVAVDPSMIYDRVQAFTPRFVAAAREHRARVGTRWRVDETLVKVGGRWRYVFRAIDEHGQVVDVYLGDHRDAASARAFFEHAMTQTGVTPVRVTSDKARCYPPALRTVLPAAEHRSAKYLNHGLERDHQFLTGRVRPMQRFKATETVGTFCRGHALIAEPRARVLAPAAGYRLDGAGRDALASPAARGGLAHQPAHPESARLRTTQRNR